MIEDNTTEFYISNFKGLIEDVLELTEVSLIKRTSYPHVRSRIDEFEASFQDLDIRTMFVNQLMEMILEAELKLQDKDSLEQISFLSEMQNYIKSKFSNVPINGNEKLTCDEKIILLEYLGVLKQLTDNNLNQKQQSVLFSLLLDRSAENVKKAIANVNGKPMRGNVKNEKSLSAVKCAIEKLNSDSLLQNVQKDLDELN
jgi:hypothetical protein